MIIVKLMGGLGNQMFQYAVARRLAWRHETRLKLDLSFLEGDQTGNTQRKPVLSHLCISAERASHWEVANITGSGRNILESTAVKLFQKSALAKLRPSVCREKHIHFDPIVLTLPDNSYLDGYWQSEKYFRDIEDIIREEFTVNYPLAGENLELAEIIQVTNSVSVHVRRGDYVASPNVNAFHGVCSADYYQDAVMEIASLIPVPNFFIFSDDAGWVKEHLKLPYPVTVVENNGPDEAYEDLRLMSLCRHHIIANSSLSWWGAWLSLHPGKIVIAPKRWFNDPSINTGDLIPLGWLRL
jgi:hypothetical protein